MAGEKVVIPVTLDQRPAERSAVKLRKELLDTARAAGNVGGAFSAGIRSAIGTSRLGQLGSASGRRDLAFEAGEKGTAAIQDRLVAVVESLARLLPGIGETLRLLEPGNRAEARVSAIAAESAAVGDPLTAETVKDLLRQSITVEKRRVDAELLVERLRVLVEGERAKGAALGAIGLGR